MCLRDIGTPRQAPKPILYHLAWPNNVKLRALQRRDLFASRVGVFFPSSDNSQPLGVKPISCSRYRRLTSGIANDLRRNRRPESSLHLVACCSRFVDSGSSREFAVSVHERARPSRVVKLTRPAAVKLPSFLTFSAFRGRPWSGVWIGRRRVCV